MMDKLGFIFCSVLLLSFFPIHDGYSADPKKELAKDFCYAMQASSLCPNLGMRLSTEPKIEEQVGSKLRGPESPYQDACRDGLNEADKDEHKGLCKKAWEMYGCYGSKVPRLIQENPFNVPNGIRCKY